MPALLSSSFHSSIAQSVLNDIQYGRHKYFHFLGRVSSWGTGDTAPTTLTDSIESLKRVRDEMVVAKRVESTEASLVIENLQWSSGTVYAMWDSGIDMTGLHFYTITPEFRVYKCLENNLGAASTVKPTTTGTTPQSTADGYIWKYMYTIPEIKQSRFLSPGFAPVQKAVTDRFYNNGSISGFVITNPGSGYVETSLTQLNAIGVGAGAVLVPKVSSNGSIVGVIVINGGTGYTTAPSILCTGLGTGLYGNTTATFQAIVSGGVIQRVAVIDPGQNYTHSTNVQANVHGDGTGAAISPVIYAGQLIDFVINDIGQGYTYATIEMVGPSTTSAAATAVLLESDFNSDQSVIEQTAIDGAIYAIKVTAPGDSYTSASVLVNGDGTGCTASATIVSGQITKINILSPGSGYTNAAVTISGNNIANNPAATSATARAILSPVGGHGKDAPTELGAKTIAIFSNLRTAVDTSIAQDYREYGLASSLADLDSGIEISTRTVLTSFLTVNFASAASMVVDEVLVSGSNRFRVLSISGNVVRLIPLSSPSADPVGSMTAEADVGRSYNCVSVTSFPQFDKYSGKVIYYSDDRPFTYSTEQSIVVKTFIKF